MTDLKKLSRQEAEEQIKNVFMGEKIPTSKQIKKVKRLAMSKNIKLGSFRKKFCKKCLTFFTPNNSEVRIKKGFKIMKCKNCQSLSRYKMK